ncbi:MAG: ATP-binding cassette domain-containing protein [Candidatus Methylomirabilia bacterium]
MNRVRPLLSVRDLGKRFGRGCELCDGTARQEGDSVRCPRCGTVIACHGVGFDLFPEEVLGIVGESGSGKSTLLRLLHFDLEPTAGRMFLDPCAAGDEGAEADAEAFAGLAGENLLAASAFRQRQVRNRLMGIVYQSPHLGLRLDVSAGGNVAERLLAAGWRSVAGMRLRATELLGRTEVPLDRIDDAPRTFSGGMQQRVQIAKALSNSPLLLLLDEPTTGLDVSVQARVLDLIRSLQRELRVAMVVVSHDLGVIRTLTSRTLVMRDGRVVEAGLTDQVLEDPQHEYTQLMVSSIL